MREVSVALRQASTRLVRRLPTLKPREMLEQRRTHTESQVSYRDLHSQLSEEKLTEKQSVRILRIVTRFLERWIWQNHTVISFFVEVLGLLVQKVTDLSEVMLCGKVPHSPVSRTGEVF